MLQAFSGLISVTGSLGGEQAKPGNSVADINAGILAALGSLRPHVRRLRTGIGSKVETSLPQVSLQQMYWFAAAYFLERRHRAADGHRPSGADRALPDLPLRRGRDPAIGGGDQCQPRKRIAEVLGHPEWVDDPRFRTGRDRPAHRAALEALIIVQAR